MDDEHDEIVAITVVDGGTTTVEVGTDDELVVGFDTTVVEGIVEADVVVGALEVLWELVQLTAINNTAGHRCHHRD